jgi:hypothetical protein
VARRELDRAAVRAMKASAERDLTIGGGKRALSNGVRTGLELLDERRFAGGVVYLRYRV